MEQSPSKYHEFIQHRIYPTKLKDYLNGNHRRDEKLFVIEMPELEMYDNCPTLLILPKNTYHKKTIIECCVRLLVDVIGNTKPKPNKEKTLENLGISEQMLFHLKSLGNYIGYFINSTSWDFQEIKNFDVSEFKKRLERCLSEIDVK